MQNGQRVLFMRTTDLVQRLQVARRELGLEAAITKLDKYQLLILDDIAYRGGPGCLNRFSASISGASAGVRLPSGGAAT